MYTEFDKRMKGYEREFSTTLNPNEPVIVRIDGRCFHTFTKGLDKPFDKFLSLTMQETMKHLCENIQGCVLGYTQSDEISLLLANYLNEKAEPFFGYRVQKLCSIIASLTTVIFYKTFYDSAYDYDEYLEDVALNVFFELNGDDEKWRDYRKKHCFNYYDFIKNKYPTFDCRVFNIPKNEVTNYFYWRQSDSYRNATNLIAKTYFSNKELYGKTRYDIIEMIQSKNDDISNYERYNIFGSCCTKSLKYCTSITEMGDMDTFTRNKWIVDLNIPLFKKEGRGYIERLLTDTQTEERGD